MSDRLVVVTGAGGFIGSHLAEALLNRGLKVRGVDNFVTGRRSQVPKGVELLEGDVNEIAGAAVQDADLVFHLAALPSVPRSIQKPMESHRATAQGTLAILTAAERAHVRRVIFASSSSVYGDAPTLPKHEGMPLRPRSPYAAAKLAGEKFACAWAGRGRLETVSLRFFNVYGPRQDPNSPYAAVIPIFARRLQEGKPMPVDGDGGQTRDFTFVGDVVQGVIRAGSAQGISGRIYNIAGGRPVSVLDMARTLAKQMGKPADFEFRPPRPGDIRDSYAETSAARRDLGFQASTLLDEGLRRTVEWMLT